MNYVELTSEILDYIEDNLKEKLSVDDLAGQFLVSRYYFGRIFRAITGYAPADYIRRRKISEAAKEIAQRSTRVLDVALDYGFDSHEVFARAFKRVTSRSPLEIRRDGLPGVPFERLEVVDRSFKHLRSELVVDFEVQEAECIPLAGAVQSFDSHDDASIAALTPFVVSFLQRYDPEGTLDRLYNVVLERPDGLYDYLVAASVEYFGSPPPDLTLTQLEPATYAVFRYARDLREIHTTVMSDICRTIVASELALAHDDLSFFVRFFADYKETGEYRIYVPLAP